MPLTSRAPQVLGVTVQPLPLDRPPGDLVVGLAGHLGLDWEAAAAPRSPPEPLGTRAWLKTQAAGIGPVPQPDTPPPLPGGGEAALVPQRQEPASIPGSVWERAAW